MLLSGPEEVMVGGSGCCLVGKESWWLACVVGRSHGGWLVLLYGQERVMVEACVAILSGRSLAAGGLCCCLV